MKPLQIGLLFVLGALGGALIMKVTQKPVVPTVAQEQPPATAPVEAAPVQASAPAAEQPPVAASSTPPAAPAEEDKKPSPMEPTAPPKVHVPVVRQEAPKPHRTPPPVRQQPVAVAQNRTPVPQPEPAVRPEPVREAPAPVVVTPPARQEPEHETPAPPPPPEPHKVTLNAGMLIPVRLVDGLSTERNAPGDTFMGTLDRELVADGFVIAERGARVEGRVVSADRGGKVRGVSGLAVELTRIRTSDGQNVAIQTDSFERHAQQEHLKDAEKVGAGAAVGAIIGAIAGGGKGAAIGAGVGGGAGAGDVLLTRGKPVALPSETRISFRLRLPVRVTELAR